MSKILPYNAWSDSCLYSYYWRFAWGKVISSFLLSFFIKPIVKLSYFTLGQGTVQPQPASTSFPRHVKKCGRILQRIPWQTRSCATILNHFPKMKFLEVRVFNENCFKLKLKCIQIFCVLRIQPNSLVIIAWLPKTVGNTLPTWNETFLQSIWSRKARKQVQDKIALRKKSTETKNHIPNPPSKAKSIDTWVIVIVLLRMYWCTWRGNRGTYRDLGWTRCTSPPWYQNSIQGIL